MTDMSRKLPIIHATRPSPHSRFLGEQVDLEFSNGERRTYERLLSSGLGAVIVVAVREDNDTVLLIREYGVGLEHYELGLPKGRLDPGETVLEGGNRELKEEVGVGARRLLRIGELSLSPSYMKHVTQVVLARDLYPERLPGDEPELLDVVPWKLSELHRLIARADVTEGRSIAALFMAREFLAGRFVPPADGATTDTDSSIDKGKTTP